MLRRIICPKCNKELYLDDAQRVHYCDYCGNMLTVHNANAEKGKDNGKVGLVIACAVLFMFVVIGFSSGSSSERKKDEQKNETVEAAKTQPEKAMATDEGDKIQTTEKNDNTLEKTELKVEVPQKPERDGFDEFNNIVEWKGINIELPGYWLYETNENQFAGVAEWKSENELPDVYLIIEMLGSAKPNNINNALSIVAENLTKSYDEQGVKYTKEIFGYETVKGYRIIFDNVTCDFQDTTYNVYEEVIPFVCENVDGFYVALLRVRKDAAYSYNNDFERILNSIRSIENEGQQVVKEDKGNNAKNEKKTEKKTNDKEVKKTETKTTNETEKKTEEKKAASSGVNPEMKAFLDSYEAFMDKYVAFTKKYVDSAGSGDLESYMAMYQDYMNLLAQLEDFERKADQYDSSKMSAEDLAYYLDSLNRIQKKMLEAYY